MIMTKKEIDLEFRQIEMLFDYVVDRLDEMEEKLIDLLEKENKQ